MLTILRRVLVLGSAAVGVGCAGSSAPTGDSGGAIVNPTGDCTKPGDGGRAGYHSPDGDTWLPDCQLSLAREYWRVFAVRRDSAYIIPRPDGDLRAVAACHDASSTIAPLLQRYALCTQATSATLARVNDLVPADALQITHYLHQQLRFEATTAGVEPYALPSDVLDACRSDPATAAGVLATVCDTLEGYAHSGSWSEIGMSYSSEQAAALAPLLNRLYGIP